MHECLDVWAGTINRMQIAGALSNSDLHELSQHIMSGVFLPFVNQLSPPPLSFANTYSVVQHHEVVRKTLIEYVAFGAVEIIGPVSEHTPPYVQPLHVIVKPGRDPRLVIDLSRNLNSFLPDISFKYESITRALQCSSANCYFSKLDVSKCYLSFALSPLCYKYFVFCFDGVYYRFVRMPFGLSTAPRICTLLLSVIAYELQVELGVVLVRYLDDFLFIAHSRASCMRMLNVAKLTFAKYGLVVNNKKTTLPTQCITFLGIEIDSVSCTLRCTEERLNELHTAIFAIMNAKCVRHNALESLVGKLSFAAAVLPGARPFMRHILDSLHRYGKHGRTHNVNIRVSQSFHCDLAYWHHNLRVWNGRQLWRTPEPFILVSDASLHGFGFYCEHFPSSVDVSRIPAELQLGTVFCGNYGPEHAEFHSSHRGIAWCEFILCFSSSTYLLTHSE